MTDRPDWILVNNGGVCEFCREDVTGRKPQDACPANQDGDTMHSTVGWSEEDEEG
jgi:hypothetical protein